MGIHVIPNILSVATIEKHTSQKDTRYDVNTADTKKLEVSPMLSVSLKYNKQNKIIK